MRLTKEEKELILKRRAEEKTRTAEKIGYLKEDLYWLDVELMQHYIDQIINFPYFTSSELDKMFSDIKQKTKCIAVKGAIFDCFIENGYESWYDREYELECLSKDFAENFLVNITKV